jgi:hypothetical protein
MSETEKHLGIQRAADTTNTTTIQERISTGRRTVYALMGAGLHGLNGANVSTVKKLINTYVLPAVLHGLEALILTEKDCQPLETYYRNLLRQVQHLPDSSANAAVYLLPGCLPITGLIHIKVLNFFVALLLQNSLATSVIKRQLAMKTSNSHSWTTHVKHLLHLYSLPSAHSLAEHPPTKTCWKIMVKQAVHEVWLQQLQEEATMKSSLSYLNLNACSLDNIHPVWHVGLDPLCMHKATTKAQLLIQRYPLTGSHCAGKRKSTSCPLCNTNLETLSHFLLHCQALTHVRSPLLKTFLGELQLSGNPPP